MTGILPVSKWVSGAAVTLERQLFTAGGKTFNYAAFRYAAKYDKEINKWKVLPRLTSNRNDVPCVFILGTHLYVAGGRDGNGFLSSMEYLNINDNSSVWTASVSLPYEEIYTSCVMFNSTVILAGGFTLPNDYLSSVITWKEGNATWTTLKPMQQKQGIHCMVSDGIRFLYVVGRFYGRNLKSIKKYDSETNTWKYLCPMPEVLYGHRCVYLKDTVIVTGGLDGFDGVNTIYLYKVILGPNHPLYYRKLFTHT